MPTAINVADIVEENGKTIRQNNMELTHDLPIGTLVDVKYETWFGKGACDKVQARLWIVSHDRDCDGTPLYSLSQHKNFIYEGAKIVLPLGFWGKDFEEQETVLREDITRNMLNNIKSGFARESLTPVPITKELEDGEGSLSWEKD